jgi:hypothetical protein
MAGARNWNCYHFCPSMVAFTRLQTFVRQVGRQHNTIVFFDGHNPPEDRRFSIWAQLSIVELPNLTDARATGTRIQTSFHEIARAKTGFARSNGLMRPAMFTQGLSPNLPPVA